MNSRFPAALFDKLANPHIGERRTVQKEAYLVEYYWYGVDFVGYVVDGLVRDSYDYIFESNNGSWKIITRVIYQDFASKSVDDIFFEGDEDQFNHDITMAALAL